LDLSHDGFLGGRLKIWQPTTGYRAATDAVLLAAAVPAKSEETALELGCGVGTASLCLATRVQNLDIVGLEVQPDYAALAEKNAVENGLKLDVIVGDLEDMPVPIRARSFDHVFANPPYFRSGTKAPDGGRAASRHERTALKNWIVAAKRRLKPGGWLTIILPVERLPDLVTFLEDGFGDVTVKPLSSREGRAPARFVLKARKGSKAPFQLCASLVLHAGAIHEGDGNDYSPIAEDILRNGAAMPWD